MDHCDLPNRVTTSWVIVIFGDEECSQPPGGSHIPLQIDGDMGYDAEPLASTSPPGGWGFLLPTR